MLGLVDSKLKELLAFKGGTALKKVYFPDYRYSEDLDFTLLEATDEDAIIEGFRTILQEVAKSQGFQFEVQDKKTESRSDSLRARQEINTK